LKKFYYDTAQGNHKGALDALRALAPTAQILFGTDFPLRPTIEEIDGLAAYGFTPDDLAAIERDNALRLLPRLKG
jgi:predicted TIM-barrel fold metal-dependent hydrolase